MLVRNPSLLATQIDDDLVMMDENSSCYFSLNAVGKIIWELLQTPLSFEDLLQAISDRFALEPAQCKKDIELFIADLLKHNLVSVV